MKIILQSLLIIASLRLLNSCQKDSIPSNIFIGTWVSIDNVDTLFFINDKIFTKPGYDKVMHYFNYSYGIDSITIQYKGPNKILVVPSTHSYSLDSSVLSINFSNGCYGFSSKKETFIKNKAKSASR